MRVTFRKEGKHTTIVTVEGLPRVMGRLRGAKDRYAQADGAFISMGNNERFHHSTHNYKNKDMIIPVTTEKLTQRQVRTRLLTMFKALNKELKEKP
jgi:hypothetical protein